MKLTYKELMEMETEQRQENFYQNMKYVAYYLCMPLCYVSAVIMGVDRQAKISDILILLGYTFMYLSLIDIYGKPLVCMMEKGKSQNVFLKYKYIPVSMKQLYRVKLHILSKQIVKTSLIAQSCAITGMLMDIVNLLVNKEKVSLPLWELGIVLQPIAVGIITYLIYAVWIYVNCYKALGET